MRKPVLSHRSLSQNPGFCIAGCDMEPIASDIAAFRVGIDETIWFVMRSPEILVPRAGRQGRA